MSTAAAEGASLDLEVGRVQVGPDVICLALVVITSLCVCVRACVCDLVIIVVLLPAASPLPAKSARLDFVTEEPFSTSACFVAGATAFAAAREHPKRSESMIADRNRLKRKANSLRRERAVPKRR